MISNTQIISEQLNMDIKPQNSNLIHFFYANLFAALKYSSLKLNYSINTFTFINLADAFI